MSGKSLSGAKDDVKGSNDKENIVENLSSSKDDVKGSEEKSELSDSQKIIDEIHKIYANRLKRIDDEAGSDGMELKVKTLQEWVNDLGEQNSMLVRTVERLEKEAADRVSLLEDNLQRSALIAQEFMKKYKNCSKKLKDNIEETEEELDVKKLQHELKDLKAQKEKLKAECDEKDRKIAELEAEIKRLQDEISNKDAKIQGFLQRIKGLQDSVSLRSLQAYELFELVTMFDTEALNVSSNFVEARSSELEAAMWKRKLADYETELLRSREELRHAESNAIQLQAEMLNVTYKLNESERLLQGAIQERNELAEEMTRLSIQLNIKADEVVALTMTLAESEKSAKDMREALTTEVAEKHDQLLALRRDVMQFEERCRQADMQTHFKDDIIKEMRKDVKLARSKVAILEGLVRDHGISGEIGQKLLALNELSYSLPSKYSDKSGIYECPDQLPSSSLSHESSIPSERIAQVVPFQHDLSHHYYQSSENVHQVVDSSLTADKTRQHTNFLRHSLSEEKLVKSRTKSTRFHGDLGRVGEALKQELSKTDDQSVSNTHQQSKSCHEVKVKESSTSTRSIAVQYSQPNEPPAYVDFNDLDARERRLLELERALQNVQNEMQATWRKMRRGETPKTTDQSKFRRTQTPAKEDDVQEKDSKIVSVAGKTENIDDLLNRDQSAATAYSDEVKALIAALRRGQGETPSDYERKIKDLEQQLEDCQVEVAKAQSLQADGRPLVPPAILLAREMEEFRVKTVEGQAAIEDLKDVMDSLHENLQTREKQVSDVEIMMTALLGTLLSTQKDLSILQEMNVQNEKAKNIKVPSGADAASGEMYSSLTAANDMVPSIEEVWIHLQKSLNKAFTEIKTFWDKAKDYSKQKEEYESNHQSNEEKVEKLYLELESTQEGLRNAVLELHDSLHKD